MKQGTLEKIQNLAVSLQLVTVEDMRKHSLPQLVTMIANKLNELMNEVHRFETEVIEMVETQNENIQYLLGEGLHLEVATVFEGWMEDGTFDTLINQSALNQVNDRIDETNAQLSEKLDKNSIVSMANMGQDVKEAMTGGSVAVVGKNSVLRENVVNGQITPEKTNFVDNRLSFTLIRGSINNGNVTAERQDERLCTSQIIENDNKMYIVRTNPDFLIGIWTYDNGVFDELDRGWQDKDVIEIPKGKGIGFNVRKRDDTAISIEEMNQARSGIEVRYEMKVAKQDEVIKLSNRLDSMNCVQTFNKSDFEVGGITRGQNESSTSRLRLTDYLKITSGDTIEFNLSSSRFKYGVTIYDKDKNWNGVDYGWLTQAEFKTNTSGYLRLTLAYADNKDITGQWLDEITNNPFIFNGNLKNAVDIISEKVNEKEPIELTVHDFEMGTITGGILDDDLRRVRSKNCIKLKTGDVIKFNKNTDDFKWGISVSKLDGTWNEIDYGWLSKSEFKVSESCLVKLIIRYNDNRDITDMNELCDKAFLVNKDKIQLMYEDVEKLKSDNNTTKNNAINSILVEYGRKNGASYVFVRIPKTTNDGKTLVPKVALTSADGSISGSKTSSLTYARNNDTIFVVNAGLFNMTTYEPVGQLIIDGVSLINEPMADDNGVPISATECYPLAIDKDWNLTTYPRNVDTSEMLNDGVRYAVTAWGKLVDNFKICQDDIDAEIVHNNKKYIRQSIGQFQNGDYCVCSVDMTRGNVENENGLYYEDLAQILIDKGVKFAYSLDGGGSTQTILGKRQLNPIYEGSTGRKVPTVITFEVA